MRILGKGLNGRSYKLYIDNLDDLWHLYNLVEKHDIVGSKTYRRMEKVDDKIRPDKSPKKAVWLAIEVEDVEFHEFSNRLRIHGTIVKGPEELGLKSHHTLNFTSGTTIELEKSEVWRSHQIELLENAVSATNQPKVIIIAIEDDNAVIGQLYQYGIKLLAKIECAGGGKLYIDSKSTRIMGKSLALTKKEFFDNILIQLKQIQSEDTPLIIIGPGFTKDDFSKYCKEQQLSWANNMVLEPTGQAGKTGIQEAIKRGVVKRLVQDSRVTFETELVNKILEEIAKEGPVSYGLTETKKAVAAGAVEKLLVIDKFIRGKHKEIEEIMANTESIGGKVIIISTVHDAGKQLEALGGIAALLRYNLNF